PRPSFGNILGCGMAVFQNADGKPNPHVARFYRIMMSESAYMIWILRNERVLQNANVPATETEIHNRWLHIINSRLDEDCRRTNEKYEKKAVLQSKVIKTWQGTLKDEQYLPPDWTREIGVLVGIEPMQKERRIDGGRRGR
ncbi:hypothetical protein C8R43DRAFT_880420, partial [Mycena crocata]